MFRVSIYAFGGSDEAEELTERIADSMHDHCNVCADGELGYVVTLDTQLDDDSDHLVAAIATAQVAYFGPAPD